MTERWIAAIVLLAAAGCSGGGSSPDSPAGPSGPPVETTTITITPAGVSPPAITVKPGSQVTFINNDTHSHDVSSDAHPDHTECPPINDVGVLLPGQQRQTGNLNVTRTCGFHDHDDPDDLRWKGTIAIQ